MDYRYLHADQFFFGTQQTTPPAGFFGQPLIINIHSVNLNVAYAASDRFNLRVTVPVSYGSQSRFYADTARHIVHAAGIGDIGLVGTAWVLRPSAHPKGNLAFGAGVKIPTGNNKFADDFFLANVGSVQHPVDQSVELGDGGWGIILQAQAFRRVASRAFAYFTGSYLLSPRNETEVVREPTGANSTVHYSVSDVYTGRLGVSYALSPEQGLSVGLGGRIDGIPYHDLIGKSDGFRRPGYVVFVDPGMTLDRGRSTFTVSTPVRVAQRLAPRQMVKPGGSIGAGDLAKVLFFVGYARRF